MSNIPAQRHGANAPQHETQSVTLPVLAVVSKLPGACFWRNNCGKFRTLDGKRVVSPTSIEGIADIMGCYLTKPVAIETKTKNGTLSESQKNFRKRWELAGGTYIIARSPEEAPAGLRRIFE
jgi:hypothetical protein